MIYPRKPAGVQQLIAGVRTRNVRQHLAALVAASTLSVAVTPVVASAAYADAWNADRTESESSVNTMLPMDTVLITDKRFRKKIIVETIQAQRSVTDTVEVKVRVVNKTGKFLQLEGRSMFLGTDGMPVEDTTAWRPIYLPPNSIGMYRESSTETHRVEHFLVELRGVKRS